MRMGVQVGGDDGDNLCFEEPFCGGLTSCFLMCVVRILMDELVLGTFVTYSAWCAMFGAHKLFHAGFSCIDDHGGSWHIHALSCVACECMVPFMRHTTVSACCGQTSRRWMRIHRNSLVMINMNKCTGYVCGLPLFMRSWRFVFRWYMLEFDKAKVASNSNLGVASKCWLHVISHFPDVVLWHCLQHLTYVQCCVHWWFVNWPMCFPWCLWLTWQFEVEQSFMIGSSGVTCVIITRRPSPKDLWQRTSRIMVLNYTLLDQS